MLVKKYRHLLKNLSQELGQVEFDFTDLLYTNGCYVLFLFRFYTAAIYLTAKCFSTLDVVITFSTIYIK